MLEIFIKKNINSGLQNNKRNHKFLSFDKIRDVLIFFDAKDWAEVQPVIDDLKQSGKTVKAWTVKPKEAKGESLSIRFSEDVRVVNLATDLNWMRVLRPEVLTEFSNVEYDTLFDFTFDKDNYVLSLLVRNKSQFYVGFAEQEYKLYDFILHKESDKTLFETYEELKKYLAHIG